MDAISIDYKWYVFRIYFNDNKIDILNSDYNLIKSVAIQNEEYKNLEKIVKKRGIDMLELFEKLLEENKIN